MAAGTVYHLHSGVTFLVNRVDGAGKAGKQEKDHTRTLRSKSEMKDVVLLAKPFVMHHHTRQREMLIMRISASLDVDQGQAALVAGEFEESPQRISCLR